MLDRYARHKLVEISRIGPATTYGDCAQWPVRRWIAAKGVCRFSELYGIEAENRSRDPAARYAAWKEQSAPIIAGHDLGAENRATVASPIKTSKLNGVDPNA